MSITYPTLGHNFKENWLFQFYDDAESSFIPLAYEDTTVDSVVYYGAIMNIANIRSNITLESSKSSTSNVSITIPNFQYDGTYVIKRLFGPNRTTINNKVKIYSQINDQSVLSSCTQIYDGKLVSVEQNDNEINLLIVAYRPFDNISIGSEKYGPVYIPVAYGDYTANASNDYDNITLGSHEANDDFQNFTYRKAPFSGTFGGESFFLHGMRDVSSGARIAFYDTSLDRFFPLFPGDDDSTNFASSGYYATETDKELKRAFYMRPVSASITTQHEDATVSGSYPLVNLIDTDNSSYMQIDITFSGGASSPKTVVIDLPMARADGKFSKAQTSLKHICSCTGASVLHFTHSFTLANGSNSTTGSLATGSSSTTEGSAFTDSFEDTMTLTVSVQRTSSGSSATFTINLYDVYLRTEFITNLDFDRKTEFMYTAADGLTESYTGGNSSTTLESPVKIHRDLLARYTDYDVADGAIVNWSDIVSDRSSWKMRINITDPIFLEKLLEKICYEGCLIFTFDNTGQGKYIYIKNSYSGGDVNYTLSNNDYSSIHSQHRNLQNVYTKMEIDSDIHPGKKSYTTRSTSSNTVTRNNLFGSSSNENTKHIKLDYLYTPIIDSADPRTDNPNASFAAYYNQIIGDVYRDIIVQIVNPDMYGIDIGDIVQFSDGLNSLPLGESWTNQYFMITNVNRKLGSLQAIAKWVYGTDPSISVTAPNGGESIWRWYGDTIAWGWDVQYTRKVKISLYKGGVSNAVLSSSTDNDGAFVADFASISDEGSDFKIRIEDKNDASAYDESDANFTVTTPTFEVTVPEASQICNISSSVTIRWNSTGPASNVKIILYNGPGEEQVISASTINDGGYSWTVPMVTPDTDYRIRIHDVDNTVVEDYSDYFTIVAA